MEFNLNNIIRNNIRNMKPYSSARDEYSGSANVFLDANENSLGSPLLKWYNRYPDPYQQKIKEVISLIKKVAPGSILLGNGSDECIDLLYRAFCNPGKDNIIICPPTYGMYEVSANINDIEIRNANLTPEFELDLNAIEAAVDNNTRLIWICSPNNPSGNSLKRSDIEILLNNFSGLVVVDEAYINFARQKTFVSELEEYPNLVVLQTFSKAWGLAGLRLGMLFASPEIVQVLNNIKPPYNINQATQELALKALEEVGQVNDMIREIVSMREALAEVFSRMPLVNRVYPSDTNFLLIRLNEDATEVYNFLIANGIVVRDRSKVLWGKDCLRITIGTEKENTLLVDTLIEFMRSKAVQPL